MVKFIKNWILRKTTLGQTQEDSFLFLTGETYKARRNVIALSATIIVIILGKIRLDQFWGIDFKETSNTFILMALIAVASYELSLYISRLLDDKAAYENSSKKLPLAVSGIMYGPHANTPVSVYEVFEILCNHLVSQEEIKNKGLLDAANKMLPHLLKQYIDKKVSIQNGFRIRFFFFDLLIPLALYFLSLLLMVLLITKSKHLNHIIQYLSALDK